MLRAGTRGGGSWSAALALAAGLSAAGMARTAVAQAGVEQFAKQPETPLEFWEAADYLFRNGRADQAAAFVRRFLESNPDDATLLEVRDEYGNTVGEQHG